MNSCKESTILYAPAAVHNVCNVCTAVAIFMSLSLFPLLFLCRCQAVGGSNNMMELYFKEV